MIRPRLSTVIVLGGLAAALAACARDESITAPEQAPAFAAVGSPSAARGPGGSAYQSKSARDSAKKAQRAAFDALRADWRTYRDSVRKGLVAVEVVRCWPLARAVETRTIGPKGGELKIGPHTLAIPAGALDRNVTITGVATSGTRREVEFSPHGLQFRQPVLLTMNYEYCRFPAGAVAEIVYTGPGNQIAARQPSLDDQDLDRVEGWTDHFSGYAVALRVPTPKDP